LSNSEGEAETQPPTTDANIATAFCSMDIATAFLSTHPMDMCCKATHLDTNVLSKCKDLCTSSEGARWELACAEEIGRLSQGLPPHYPTGRNTFRFIARSAVPRTATVTYLRIVTSYRPQKGDPYRVRFTVGGVSPMTKKPTPILAISLPSRLPSTLSSPLPTVSPALLTCPISIS
jgi:hypothetical protein